MAFELKVPNVGESITEVQIGNWLKQPGEYVERDEPVVEIESDKATVEVFAPVSGVISEVLKQTGEAANVGDVIGQMEEQAAAEGGESPKKEKEPARAKAEAKAKPVAVEAAEASAEEEAADETKQAPKEKAKEPARAKFAPTALPAAKRLAAERGVDTSKVKGSGRGGRVLKEDVDRHTEEAPAESETEAVSSNGREEDVVPMSPMRKRIAHQLVTAQQNAALLTTFNEIDMSRIVALRGQYKQAYLDKYDIKLGFMSFFVKACIEGLREFPQVNAEVRGTDIVYRNYYDIGIAVGSGKGLVVPVLRNAERMSFAEIEKRIDDFGKRAQANKITLDELKGGTFTISNGGIYGSMLSTPIVNPPQSAILGMHAIQERAVVRDGQIVIRPMMFVALSYDHRIIDGREAVTFLVRVKSCLEEPSRILLEI